MSATSLDQVSGFNEETFCTLSFQLSDRATSYMQLPPPPYFLKVGGERVFIGEKSIGDDESHGQKQEKKTTTLKLGINYDFFPIC